MQDPTTAEVDQTGRVSRAWLIGALVLLLVHLVWGMLESSFVVNADGAEYVQMADNLQHLGRFTYDGVEPVVGKPPGLPAFIALYQSVVGSLAGFHVMQLLFLFGAYLFTTAVIRDQLGEWPALAVLATLVCIDALREPTTNAYTEPLFFFLTSVGMWATVQLMNHRSRWHAALAALAYASATYVRPVGLFWPLALLFVVFAFCRPAPMKQLISLLVIHAILIAPWVIRNSRIMERPVPFVANWQPMYGMSDAVLWESFWRHGWIEIFTQHGYEDSLDHQFPFNPKPAKRLFELTQQNIRRDVSGFFGRCIKQFCMVWTLVPGTREWEQSAPVLFWLGRGLMLVFYGFCAIGVISTWRISRVLAGAGCGYALYTAAIHFTVTTDTRYLLCAYLWLLPLTTAGVIQMTKAVRARRRA